VSLVISRFNRISAYLFAGTVIVQPAIAWADDPKPKPAEAPQPVDADYERHMGIGIRLFEDRNYDAALTEFERAYERRKVASPLINIALCHKGRFEYPRAIAVLERALRDHRNTIESPEKIERALKELRELLAFVTVRIAPKGAGATLILDGVEIPQAAASGRIAVSPGGHELTVRRPDFEDASTSFRVGSGDERTIDIALKSNVGSLSVAPANEDDELLVTIDGIAQPRGPYRGRLAAGTHLVVIERNRDRFTVNVPIVATQELRLAFEKSGFLRVPGAPPRGPDVIETPPVRGPYASIGGKGGFFAGNRFVPYFGFELWGGYRFTNSFGLELVLQQALPLQVAATQNFDSLTLVGPGIRLMTDTPNVRFVQGIGVGFAAAHFGPQNSNPDSVSDSDVVGGFDYGVYFSLKPELDVEVSQFIFGFATPISLAIANAAFFELGLELHFGYGFW
jgi:hypothetical protein